MLAFVRVDDFEDLPVLLVGTISIHGDGHPSPLDDVYLVCSGIGEQLFVWGEYFFFESLCYL